MSELYEIIEEEYLKQISDMDLQTLIGMIEEVLDSPAPLKEEAPPTMANVSDDQAMEMLLKMIPDIEVSEIGWSDVRTPEDQQEIKGPQRQLLEGYLENIQGSTFGEKIQSVSKFYTEGSAMVAEQAGDSRTQRIMQVISYLVFYKTLTKVITNFNAASAGFSFESFLAALVNGKQIPTGSKTIADYLDRATGETIPVSLKLYRHGGLEVGGSYTDLVNDLVSPQYPEAIGGGMRYVVCTKEFDTKRKGLEQQGKINFYQFDFNLDNVLAILASSRLPDVARLPQLVVSALAAGQQVGAVELLNLPAKEKELSAEELTPLFDKALEQEIKKQAEENPDSPIAEIDAEHLKKLLAALDWEKNDNIFNKEKVRGKGALNKALVKALVRDLYGEVPDIVGPLRAAIVNANAAVVNSQKAAAKKSARNQQIDDMIGKDEFLSVEESVRQYSLLGKAQKKQALLSSLGYLKTHHFSLNEKQALNSSEPTNTVYVGSINVGRALVAQVLGQVRNLLNAEVYEIFQSLKILSDSLNQYFAGGLENDSLAGTARTSATNISSTEILQSGDEDVG